MFDPSLPVKKKQYVEQSMNKFSEWIILTKGEKNKRESIFYNETRFSFNQIVRVWIPCFILIIVISVSNSHR